MKIKPAIILLFLFLTLDQVGRTQIPAADLFLADLTNLSTEHFHIKRIQFLSQFNEGGYTNQPAFMNDDEVFVSVRKTTEDQNDIFCIDISKNTIRQVTDTPQSEYSPTILLDGKSFACVREIIGDQINQKLYKYPFDQSSNGENMLNQVKNIGYFAFTTPNEIALFLIDSGSKLAVAEQEKVSFLSSNIGRCLKTTENGSLLYIHKYTDSFWYLKKYDLKAKKASIIVRSLPEKEDFCTTPDGQILMGDGAKLYLHSGKEDTEWKMIADLSEFGISNITRLSMNNRYQLVFVNQ